MPPKIKLNRLLFKLQKKVVSTLEKVSDIVPKIGGGIGPRRTLFKGTLNLQKQMDKQFKFVLKEIAGDDPVMRRQIR